MNKIKVVNNVIIPLGNDSVVIENNTITFLKNGNYYIEYIDSNNINLTINIPKDIYISLFEYASTNRVIMNKIYNIYGNLILSKFYYNESTLEENNIFLNEENASIKYNFSSISNADDKYYINIKHLIKNTRSDIYNRTVAKEGSSNIFDINSYVENGITDTHLNQQTKIVTLGDSDNKINPNMFIGDYSCTAIHSSVIGNINEDDLFYLMSRGISYKEAVKLIIKGMILSNINVDMEYKEKILNILDMLGGENSE